MRSQRLKRVMDVLGAGAGLLVFAPVMLVVAVLIRLRMGSPVLFRQTRPGLHGQPFDMVKFRTMRHGTDARGNVLSDAQRLTPLGRFLRASSLDELPGLWNVLRGDMSLVGPRPLLMEYLPLYSPFQARRHEARPGITGWAQVNGRNAISWDEKFALDIWYVDNQNLWLDLKIIGLTVLKVFRREGISAPGDVTMPRFTGQGGQMDDYQKRDALEGQG
ncbi:MAG: sugar transferase [Brevundimonas sp.]|jgi:lipopolysaccharide/colanic/teichoic acid biosynthesis glycosyltransferase|uniref:sugar transferase n=1 Tax=Brevundimonas sp. TaxID=1871086 RepID=UPI00391C1078